MKKSIPVFLMVILAGCNVEDETTPTISTATVTTNEISNTSAYQATGGGQVVDEGGSPVVQRGVCWDTSPNPTRNSDSTSDGSGPGSFTSNVRILSANTLYYVRAYAVNSSGTSYGNQVTFTTSPGSIFNPDLSYGTVFDIEGNEYATIVIDGIEWMAQNLRTAFYANGDPIPNVTSDLYWGTQTTGAWVHYDNDSQNENPYGKLYNWYAGSDSRNICPSGWHVPSDDEWMTMVNHLGGLSVAGGKMKSTGTDYWTPHNTAATNESGFSGLPGGYRHNVSGVFDGIGGYWFSTHGYWWTSTQTTNLNGWSYGLSNNNRPADKNDNMDKGRGLCVRCVRD